MNKLNKSASRVVDILSLIAKSKKALTITEISKKLDIPKSSTFNILYTLEKKGFLEIDNDKLKTFKLGLKVFKIGTAYIDKNELTQVANPILEELMNQLKETVFLAVEDNEEIVYLNKFEPNNSMRVTAKLGSRYPLYCTSLGKAILATYSKDKIEEKIGNTDLELFTDNTIKTLNKLYEELEITRKRGYAIDNQECVNDVICVGAPIYNNKKAIAAISTNSFSSNFNKKRIKKIGPKVNEAALDISNKLGYSKNELYI